MERRFYLGVGILVLFLVLGLLTGWAVAKSQAPIVEKLEQAAMGEDFQTGIRLAKEAEAAWQKSWKLVASIADHTPMDEIDQLFAEMEIFAREEEQVHFYACCSQLAVMLRAVSEAHELNWWNVL